MKTLKRYATMSALTCALLGLTSCDLPETKTSKQSATVYTPNADSNIYINDVEYCTRRYRVFQSTHGGLYVIDTGAIPTEKP